MERTVCGVMSEWPRRVAIDTEHAFETIDEYDEAFSATPIVEGLDKKMMEEVRFGRLAMDEWTSECGTYKCIAGWAVHFGGRAGRALAEDYGWATAGALIYLRSEGYVPDFFASYEEAVADIKARSGATA